MQSHVSDLLGIATNVYKDAVAKCTDVTLDVRDLLTLKSRVEHEGLSFLTITLPTLGQDFERSLSISRIDSTRFRSFRKRGKIPAFLQGFFNQVFDIDGRIFNEPSIEAIESIRQIAYTFKKLEVPCTPIRVKRCFNSFKDNEQLLKEPLLQDDVQKFLDVSHCLWSNVFTDGIDFIRDVRPKHGPGATAEGISGNAKYIHRNWHDRLEPYFPLLDNAFASASAYTSEGFQKVSVTSEEEELPVRVISVPKTLKGPRIIAIEPVCMQYTQQALSRYITDILESSPLTAGHVNFTDQSINRDLAIMSSRNRKYATLDLSAASDLVPYELAIRMFDINPDLQGAISACRTKTAKLPDGDLISLRKFASMGSALCFPIEAMYFYTICVMASLEFHNLPLTFLSIKKVVRNIYVYGDDIIVPTNESEVVSRTLQKYYCKVNTSKSFSNGKFRESCGMDAYAGEEVTPTYLRQLPPRNKRDTRSIISWIATSNLFYQRGYWQTSSALFKWVESLIGELPIVGKSCAGLGKISFQKVVSIERWNKPLQRYEVKTFVGTPVYKRDILDDYPALLKCLLLLESNLTDSKDAKHLSRSARHGAVALKRRWILPY